MVCVDLGMVCVDVDLEMVCVDLGMVCVDLRAEVLVGQQAHLRWPTHQGVIYPMLVSGVGDICIIDGGGGRGGGGGGGCTHTIWRNEQTSKLKKSSNTIICVLGLVCVNVCVCVCVCGE